MNCIFCNIISGAIPAYKVWENDKFFAFLDINPLKSGHLLVMPKAHIDYIFDMPDDLYSELFITAKKLSPKLKEVTSAKRIGILVVGLDIAHVHVHLVPINKGNDLNPENAHPASDDELKAMQQKLKSAFDEIK